MTTRSYYPLLIPLAPLLAGIFIGLFGNKNSKVVYRVAVVAVVSAFALSLLVLYQVIAHGALTVEFSSPASPWNGSFHFGQYIDRLAAVMMVHITAISALVHIFSLRYMQQERGYARFFSMLAIETFVLIGMVSSSDLLTLFLFWQLLTWVLSLLSFNYAHGATTRGVFRVFSILRFGDIVFLLGVVVAYALYGTLDLRQLAIRANQVPVLLALWPGAPWQVNGVTLVTLLIFAGAMSKSAQFPLHTWVTDSLYAPTPVSALLHAGIINAGGFLLARLAPFYDLSPTTLHVAFAVGLLTALLGSSMMLIQNDVKKTLAYSTVGQMGFMLMECGLGAYGLAVFHLIAHGIFKGTLFLSCGNVIHAARKEPRLPSRDEAAGSSEFSSLSWFTGFALTLFLPLIIVLAGHGVLRVPLADSHGAVIFLFFGWATSAQAILTLYRLNAVASWKIAATMVVTLFVVVVTYLWAAESFTDFLYPAAGEVAAHFKAGALPSAVFDLIVALAALSILLGWALIYAHAHGRSIRLPAWVGEFKLRLYLLLMNRLYLDGLALRAGQRWRRLAGGLNSSSRITFVLSFIAVAAALARSGLPQQLSPEQVLRFFAVAAMLPLFPLHGLYIAALARSRGYLALGLSISMPMAGLYGVGDVLAALPAEALLGIRLLALCGALFGTFKALTQDRFSPLLAYASLSFHSILWWHLSSSRALTPAATIYFIAVVLSFAGFSLAWRRLQLRYGHGALDGLRGLARPMPRFATLFALFAMAALGLPPFGLFSGYIGMLFHPSVTVSWDLMIILLAWFGASVYLYRMMQRLLWGPHVPGIVYDDLRWAESVPLAILLAIIIAVGFLPYGVFDAVAFSDSYRGTLELTTSWLK